MKNHIANAAWGILDYAAYPIGMLAVAPVVLRNLGTAQYGVWTLATVAVSIGGIIASGFGDANIQYVANRRGAGDPSALLRAVRCMMGINLVLGVLFSVTGWALSPLASRHAAGADLELQRSCLWSLRVASVLMAVRAVESVCISTQRAFERYGAAVRISILARLLALVAGAGLTFVSRSVVMLMAVAGILMMASVYLQLRQLKRLLSAQSLLPAFNHEAVRALFGFGIYSWLQAVSGVVFNQIDRLMLGVSLGATAVTSYALCTQMAQPRFGFDAAGLHFLFPYLSHRAASTEDGPVRSAILIAFACNLTFVAISTAVLLLFGGTILRIWVGAAIAQAATPVLSMILWSSALLGLSVTASYALLALGRFRTVTLFNLTGGVTMALLMFLLAPRLGIRGIAIARLGYAFIPLCLYVPLFRQLLLRPASHAIASRLQPACEEQ